MNNKIIKIILTLISSIIISGAIIFFIQIIYPAPYWKNICNEACNENQQITLATHDILYRNTIQKIFLFICLLFLVSAISSIMFKSISKRTNNDGILLKFFNHKKNLSSLLISISILTGIYGYSDTLNRLLFPYGQSLSVYYSLFIFLILTYIGFFINKKTLLN